MWGEYFPFSLHSLLSSKYFLFPVFLGGRYVSTDNWWSLVFFLHTSVGHQRANQRLWACVGHIWFPVDISRSLCFWLDSSLSHPHYRRVFLLGYQPPQRSPLQFPAWIVQLGCQHLEAERVRGWPSICKYSTEHGNILYNIVWFLSPEWTQIDIITLPLTESGQETLHFTLSNE